MNDIPDAPETFAFHWVKANYDDVTYRLCVEIAADPFYKELTEEQILSRALSNKYEQQLDALDRLDALPFSSSRDPDDLD